jgi:hypothetical protein
MAMSEIIIVEEIVVEDIAVWIAWEEQFQHFGKFGGNMFEK